MALENKILVGGDNNQKDGYNNKDNNDNNSNNKNNSTNNKHK